METIPSYEQMEKFIDTFYEIAIGEEIMTQYTSGELLIEIKERIPILQFYELLHDIAEYWGVLDRINNHLKKGDKNDEKYI